MWGHREGKGQAIANPEHLEIVKQGTAAIARWRKEHPDVWLDLRSADLCGANLCDSPQVLPSKNRLNGPAPLNMG